MKITTDEFSLTKREYFKILIINALHNRWFLFILFFLVSALGTKMTMESVIAHFAFFLLMCSIYLLYVVTLSAIKSWLFKGNSFLLSPQRCEIDHEFIAVYWADGSLKKINLLHITKMIVRKDHFLFYYPRNQFIYLPLKAFNNPTDAQALRTLIQVKSG